MKPVIPSARYERKFLPGSLTLPEILALIRRHPALFREVYPKRVVNNVYLDTPGLTDYRHHVDGAAERLKHRIRWYGPTNGKPAATRFEVKIKKGLVSGKTVHDLASMVDGISLLNGGFQECLDRPDLSPAVRVQLAQLRPMLFNTYSRLYFLSADHRFRLTVDSGLQFSGRLQGWRPSPAQGLQHIIELKYEPQHAEAAAGVTNELPFRMVRCSKYVLGIEQLGLAR